MLVLTKLFFIKLKVKRKLVSLWSIPRKEVLYSLKSATDIFSHLFYNHKILASVPKVNVHSRFKLKARQRLGLFLENVYICKKN